nr:PREDICTED: probable phospholipid-transporting ATPase IF [Latimeria chalumnae]|eukprot:XP_014340178.1 PREDICTED: probable phospholipid-transporting ATPase IF [Latimeria chalumnae]
MLRWIRQQLGFDPPHQSDTRTVYIANRFPQHGHYVPQKFADNRIISSKYTVWNFIPKNLFEQFRRIANFYFLIIFLVQLMIDTPTSPVTSGLPLFFVITVTAIKQGYEDWLRHKADNEVNGAPVYVVRSGGLVKTRSKNIRVGDIVRVAKDETFPVDLVLLSSDREDGTCHVTTASLDGETNLKTHFAVPETAVLQSVTSLDTLSAVIECQQPEADLYRYGGLKSSFRSLLCIQGWELFSILTQEEELFLKAVSLCHTVQISYDQTDGILDGFRHANGVSSSHMEYYASSPDEKALVEATRRIGVSFTGGNGENLEIKIFGKPERYKLLHVLEFDANRRRMSVIVQTSSGDQFLFTKGAESSILPNTKGGEIDKTRLHVNEFALKGLRTLCVAYRRFIPEEYKKVDRCLHEARTALQQREERLAEAFDFIERDLHLLGATAVEDKLQDKVQETIEALRVAGIKVWVLTGDKHETAVSVSLSCGHFHRAMNILELIGQKTDNDCAEQLRRLARRIKEDHVIQHGLVVDGASLSLALREHEKLFMEVCRNCSAVLCCRMAPLQKAKVVRLLKTSPEKPITLAIGDGANDVSMIQEAHVGIGIMGKEGRQAVRNSDYAIARFKFLSKLLLVHGHLYYVRIATLVQYFFYKNVCFITPQFLYQFYCLFSQQTLYDSVYLTLYNICFTSLPILMYSLFEQHVHPHVLQTKPALYRDIRKNALLAFKTFLYWTLLGFCHAFIFFFGSYFLMGEDTSLMGNGQMFGNWTFGTLVFTVLVITVTLKLASETHFWTWINHFVTWGSIVFYFIFSLFYGGIIWPFLHTQDMYFVFVQLLSSGSAWFAIILIVITCLFPDVIKKVILRHMKPTVTEKAQTYSRVSLGDDFIALQPLSMARNQLGKISLPKQTRVSTAWTPCAVSLMGRQHVPLLEECWSEQWEGVAHHGSTDHGVNQIPSITTTEAS